MGHYQPDPAALSDEVQKANYVVVASRWNGALVEKLLVGTLDALRAAGVPDEQVDVVRVPGAFELPLAAQAAIERSDLDRCADAVIALGVVIRGQTPHFDFICTQCSSGLSQVMLDTGVPIGFGVITAATPDQAEARAVVGGNNKGTEAAQAAMEMIAVLQALD